MIRKYKTLIIISIIIAAIFFKYQTSVKYQRIVTIKLSKINKYFQNPDYNKWVEDHLKQVINNWPQKIDPVFDIDGIDDIALISMVKNENDIIFENLMWHFTIGFRKFIIIDNMSTDGTKEKIEEFAKLTKNHAKVFIIEDPIFEHIQSRIITGSYDFARSVWPELKWIFPIDADEFWVPTKKLKDILANIPKNVDAIAASHVHYYPTEDYYKFSQDTKFYQKIHHHAKIKNLSNAFDYSSGMTETRPKVAIRSINNILIHQGNHGIDRINSDKFKSPFYLDGRIAGLEIYEYSLRSSEQTHKKFYNSMKANKKAKELGILSEGISSHWDEYAQYIEKYKENAKEVRFKETFINQEDSVDEPMPFKDAYKVFNQIINNKK